MHGMTTTPNPASIEALIAAAGMTCYAEECDTIIVRRAPRVVDPFVPASEVVPPFAGD